MKRVLFALLILTTISFLSTNSYSEDLYIDGAKYSEEEIESFQGMSEPPVSATNTARLYFDSSTDLLMLSEDTGDYSPIMTGESSDTMYLRLDLDNSPLQPISDSTTKLQILDADGGTPILNIDTTNERVGIGTTNPTAALDVTGDTLPQLTIGRDTDGYVGLLLERRYIGKYDWYIKNAGSLEIYGDDGAGGLPTTLRVRINDTGKLDALDGLSVYDSFGSSANLYIGTGGDSGIGLEGGQTGDTWFWLANINDNEADDDDTLQIGKGNTIGTTPYFTLNPSGNVGIGTTIPVTKLEVNGVITCGGASAGQSIVASGLVVNEDGGATAADDFRVETDTQVNAFVVDASGNDIEINVPTAIVGAVGITGTVTATAFAGNLTGNVTGNADTVTTNANLTGVITSAGNATSIASQTGTGTTFVVDTSPTLVTPDIGAAVATTLYISGNVGIGDISPDYPLEILSTINPQFSITNSEGEPMKYFTISVDATGDVDIVASGGDIDCGSSNLTTIGNVGIGTTAPDTRLDLAGTLSWTPSATQVIDAATDTVLANAALVVVDPDGNYTLTSTPTIADGAVGQIVYITCPEAEANGIAVQDQDTLANSNLQLGAASRNIAARDVLVLIFNGVSWVEVSYANN